MFLLGGLLVFSSSPVRASVDLNGNGLGDIWEFVYGAGALSAAGDTDGDGQTSLDESVAGTNPFDPNSRHTVSQFSANNYAVTLRWPSVAGKQYFVQNRADLKAGNWVSVVGPLAGTGDELTVNLFLSGSPSYYRILARDVDTDNDGVSDWEELQIGYDPNKTDSDGNGVNDLTQLQTALSATNVISVKAGIATASEQGPTPGTFIITRTGNLNPITVNYTLSGNAVAGLDFVPVTLSATLPLAVNSAVVTVMPMSDAVLESPELVTLNISPNAAYVIGSPANASLTISDPTTPTGTGLLGQYYDNASSTYGNAANFSGLKVTRVDPTVDFFWGSGRPFTQVSNDNFSASYDAVLVPSSTGDHVFDLQADDGARLYLGNQLIIDAWAAGSATATPLESLPQPLIAGSNYPVRVEYYETTNAASVFLRWRRPGNTSFSSISTANILDPTLSTNRWFAQYFNNTTLTAPPAVTNLASAVSFDWGVGFPAPGVDLDTFSIRWTGQVQPERSETYTFVVLSDDGVKLWVNGQLIIDGWVTGSTTRTGTIALQAGVRYDIKLEYFENTGSAQAKLYWYSPSQVQQIIPQNRLYPSTAPAAPANVTSPVSAFGLVGGPFVYQLTGSNLPMLLGATGLPPGLTFNATTGLITGNPTLAGSYQVVLSSSNSVGVGYSILDLTIINAGGTVAEEYWTGITGTSVTNIPLTTAANGTNQLTSLQAPTNWGDNYGARIRGYITAPTTGNYRFWIASANASEFWLSNNHEPAALFRRAWVTNATAAAQWNAEPNQQSPLLRLRAGQRYYFEILHKAGTGSDHLAVGWLKPGEAGSAPSEIVPGYTLSPYVPPAPATGQETLYVATMTPVPGAVSTGSGISTLRMSADETSAELVVDYSNLTGPTSAAHVHDAGHGGAIMFDLDTEVPVNGVYHWTFAPTGSLTVTDIVNSIKSGNAYVNVHTAAYPGGEIKGFYRLAAGSQTFTPPPAPPALPGGTPTTNDVVRFLSQATFGATTGEVARVRSLGFNAWLDDQFNAPVSSHLNYVYDYYTAFPTAATNATPTRQAWWKHAVTAPDQLRQRVAFALSEIFVVSSVDGDLNDEPWGLSRYYDLLVTNAFGNCRQLLEAVTLSPCMGDYLDMRRNDKPDQAKGLSPNENYAREVLQLFSIGLKVTHPDGTLKLDSQGLPVTTYDQDSVVGYAHVFTGWNYYSTTENWNAAKDYLNQMTPVSSHHDTGEKLLLNNVVLPANQTTAVDLQQALDLIFNHPNLGPFISRQLIQRLVTSNPSPAYIYRVAAVFNDNGAGVRGDLKAVVKAILLDYEARTTSLLGTQGYGHQREPVLRVANVLRAFNAFSNTGNFTLNSTDATLAQTPLNAPTVFNFFEPDYSAPGEISAAGLYSPEFQITSETTTMNAANYMWDGIRRSDGIPGNSSKGFGSTSDVELVLDYEKTLATNPAALVDHLGYLLMGGNVPAALRTIVINHVNTLPSTTDANKLDRVRQALHLLATSPEFTIEK